MEDRMVAQDRQRALALDESEPAFRKWTPVVQRGIRYAIAQLRFDAEHEPNTIDGEPVATSITNEDLAAAENWLRDQLRKRSI